MGGYTIKICVGGLYESPFTNLIAALLASKQLKKGMMCFTCLVPIIGDVATGCE